MVSPGHVFPLKARRGGVLVRTGQTEGSVDSARLAGLAAAGVICGSMRDTHPGEMARMPHSSSSRRATASHIVGRRTTAGCRPFTGSRLPPPDAAPSDRISLVFFTNPNPDAEVRCLEACLKPGETAKYPPITVSEHYLGKLMKAGHSNVDAKAADALTH